MLPCLEFDRPYIPDLRQGKSYAMPISEVMKKVEHAVIALDSTYQEVADVLSLTDATIFPLVDSKGTNLLLGAVRRKKLGVLLDSFLDFESTMTVFDHTDATGGLATIGSYVNYGDERDELPSHQRRNDTMSPETKHKMRQRIDLRGIEFDPSPFQLVAKTSLYKVHTLFSLLGVTVAYVPCRQPRRAIHPWLMCAAAPPRCRAATLFIA